ncbi:MAG: serine hydrolase domain-containing protein [Chitinophagaceae bacterium]
MKLILVLFFLSVPFFNAFTQKIAREKLDRLISYIEANNQGVGAVSVFSEGKEVYHRSFGQHAINNLKFNAHSKYQVGSITKVFTAVLIWKLIESGKLSLADKLSAFYPQIPNAEKISIRNLLEHSSGIRRDYGHKSGNKKWLLDSLVKDQEIIDEITRQGVEFEPGDSVAYSNSGFYLLKNIAEQRYGQSYGKLINKHIIKPTGLKDLASADMTPGNLFSSYAYNYAENTWMQKTDYLYRNIIGVGDIATTPSQVNKFLHQLFQGKILRRETVLQMLPAGEEEFGRNLTAVNIYKKVLYGHAGDTKGSHSLAVYDTANNIAIAICINGERYPYNNFYADILRTIYTEQDNLPYFASAQEIKEYAGTYTDKTSGLQLRIYLDEQYGLLCEDVREEVSFPLSPYAFNQVRFDLLGIRIEFRTNDLTLFQNGTNTILKKQQ